MRRYLCVLLCLLTVSSVQAQERFTIAVIDDGPSDRLLDRRETYVQELLTLTENEFDVQIQHFSANWTADSITTLIERVYADDAVDYVLLTGFVGNQLAAQRAAYPKPTFLPVVLDTNFLSRPPVDQKSGIPNLSYLTVYSSFDDDLDALGAVVSFDSLVLLMDEEFSAAIPELKQAATAVAANRGILLSEVTHDGVNHNLMAQIPAATGAVFVAGLPRLPASEFARLVQDINAAGIPSYSFVGTDDVERGLLMTSSESRDIERQARLNALNMQAVMLGESPEDQPIAATATHRFTINMQTARQLGISPSFNVLNESNLLNERPVATGREYGLVEVALEAIERNQDLLAQSFGTLAGAEEIGLARSSLLPQLGLSGNYDVRKVSPLVDAGLAAERTTDGALSLQQLIYSDSAFANLTIQKQFQSVRENVLLGLRLDIVQEAASAYYNVLNAESQLDVQENNLEVTRRNLELARNRVSIGSTSAADTYRWQAEVARARTLVLDAQALVNQAWNRLNRLLHRPQDHRLALRAATFNDPFVLKREEFESLVASPADYSRFSRYLINRGLGQSPELAQVDAQIIAKRRELTSQKRAYWLPDFSLGGRYGENFDQSGAGGGPATGEGLSDWSFGVQATLPLFSGGARRASVNRADYELRELNALRMSTEERVEEGIRFQLHAAQADYVRIALSAEAAEASRKNYELVADAYASGTVSIVQLLDAQEASLSADAAEVDSFYGFMVTIMALQRSVGGFDYLLPEEQRLALAESMRDYLRGTTQ